jgi:hypothetical protein
MCGCYARDTATAMGRWPFALDEIDFPFGISYSEPDTGHSPDNLPRVTRLA